MKTGKEYLLDKIGGNNPEKYNQKTLDLISYWMDEYAKYYHEQQVKNCDLADVGGSFCVICGLPCEPSPTEDGWAHLEVGKGVHFGCAEKIASSEREE